MNNTYLLLGSNLGNSEQILRQARGLIEAGIGRITRSSALYRTAAWGNREQPDFLNQVILVQTNLLPTETLQQLLQIEQDMGRTRSFKNAPRTIDIDILFFNNSVINTQHLRVPHPEIPNRRFVLVPMNELAPNLLHPTLNKNIHRLLLECKDPLDVKKF